MTEEEKSEETKEKGLSHDEALLAAIQKHTAPPEEIPEATDTPQEAQTEPEVEEVEPPSEFNNQEKEAWISGDKKGIRNAWDRVNRARLSEMDRLNNELRAKKDSAPQKTDDVASKVVEAIKANPVQAIHEIMRVRGLTKEQVLADDVITDNFTRSEIGALQNKISSLESKLAENDQRQLAQVYGNVFESIVSEKTEAGDSRYPDLNDTESGLRLAASIGSLTRSADFQRTVRSSIPNAGLRELSIAAYKALGGSVVEGNQARSQNNTQKVTHITQARRASASVPGRAPVTQRAAMPKQTYKDDFDALKAAVRYLNSEE